jgi:hypothetical protein
MSSPVDQLRGGDPDSESDTENEERIRAASLLGALAKLRPRRHNGVLARLQVRGSFALDSRNDKARLHPPKEHRVFGERLRELGGEATPSGGTTR